MITSTTPRGPGTAAARTTPLGGRGSSRRASARRPAERVAHLVPLELDVLRDYRQELITEEARVSYWRRILQARIDTSVGDTARDRDGRRLRSVLTQHQESSRRLAVLPVHDPAALPPLPDLTALWETEGSDDAEALTRLAAAEAELSAYRRSLHERLDDATSELIARYREEPGLALRALPVPRSSGAA
ncbi:MAG TPA: hypothetical protein VH857_09635 [Actinomycetes bacterium]|nr:hypothetical protein [Actinomycetes bacterium]